MTDKEKDLLIKDLSCRLPYGINVHAKYTDDLGETIEVDGIVKMIDADGVVGIEVMYDTSSSFIGVDIDDVKPYLFPIDSMTEEQKKEYRKVCELDTEILSKHPMDGTPFPAMHNSQDWLNAHHFDYRGLIPIGLANDATGLNIY